MDAIRGGAGNAGGDEQYVQQLEAELDSMRRMVTELRLREARDQHVVTGEHPSNGRASPSTLFAQELERMESGGYVATRSYLDSPVKSNAIGGKVPKIGAGRRQRRQHLNIVATQSALLLHSARVKRELINLKAGLANVRAGGAAMGSTLGSTQLASALGVLVNDPEPEPEPEPQPEPEAEPEPEPKPEPEQPQLNPKPLSHAQETQPPPQAQAQAQAQTQLDPDPQSQGQGQGQGQEQQAQAQAQLQGAEQNAVVVSEPQIRLPQIRRTEMTRPGRLDKCSNKRTLSRGTGSRAERSRLDTAMCGPTNRWTRSPYVRALSVSEDSSATPSLPLVHRNRNRDWDRDRNRNLNQNQNRKKRVKVRRNRRRADTSPVFERHASPTPSESFNQEINDRKIPKATAIGARDLGCFLIPAGKEVRRRRRLQRESMVV